jgi:hypothetical protein
VCVCVDAGSAQVLCDFAGAYHLIPGSVTYRLPRSRMSIPHVLARGGRRAVDEAVRGQWRQPVGCPLWEHLLPRLDTFVLVRGLPAVGAPAAPARHLRAGAAPPYCDPKVANREIWFGHLVIENGY